VAREDVVRADMDEAGTPGGASARERAHREGVHAERGVGPILRFVGAVVAGAVDQGVEAVPGEALSDVVEPRDVQGRAIERHEVE
jgi:hypothetical protein